MSILNANKLLTILTVLLISSLCFQSCGSDDDDPESGTMTADIDGAAWVADISGGQIQNGLMNVTGATALGETITLTMDGTVEGTYDLGGTNPSSVAAYSPDVNALSAYTSNAAGAAATGEVIVSEINTEEQWITGTFSFLAINPSNNDEKVIENGQFTQIPILIDTTTNAGSSLMAKVDGVDWIPNSVLPFTAQGRITITATKGNNETSLGLIFPDDIAVGTYELDWTTDIFGNFNLEMTTQMVSNGGTLTVTEHNVSNKHIEGSFSFLAEETAGTTTRDITEGTFSVDY